MGITRSGASIDSVLVAGATGLVGRSLLLHLLEHHACEHVLVLARHAAPDALVGRRKLTWQQVDFARLAELPLPPLDAAFIALGTTIKAAGSEAAFRAVDFDHVVAVAQAARKAGASRLAVVSALGADASSRVFYNRVKGETEAALTGLGFESLVMAQPSLLVGDRRALGQPTRRGEMLATRLLGPVMGLVPRRVRPIAAADVAAAMVAAILAGPPGARRLSSAQMQGASSAGPVAGSG